MKTIIIALICMLVGISTSFANTIYRTNGEVIDKRADLNLYPKQFVNKADALAVASKLENGDVFQDHDTHLYQVFYGNVKITGVVVISSIEQK